MAACERCWKDAYGRMLATGKPQGECYLDIVRERTDDKEELRRCDEYAKQLAEEEKGAAR